MSTLQLVYAVIIFVTVTAAAMVILLPFAPNRAKKRLESVAGATGYGENAAQADWTETIVKLAGPFAKLSLPLRRMGRIAAAHALHACGLQG